MRFHLGTHPIPFTVSSDSLSSRLKPNIICTAVRWKESDDSGSPSGTVPHICRDPLIEIRFMTDHEDAAAIIEKGPPQLILRIHVQMIGGLVQEKDICLFVNQLAQAHLGLLAAA